MIFRFIRWLFGRSPKISYLGRAGLIFRDNGTNYHIDSEMLVGGEYDIVVCWLNIRYEDVAKDKLLYKEKINIAIKVKKELEYEGLVVEMEPLFPNFVDENIEMQGL